MPAFAGNRLVESASLTAMSAINLVQKNLPFRKRPHCGHLSFVGSSYAMQLLFSILAPLIGLFLATVMLAFLVHRKVGRIWVAALAGGSIIPGIALLDGVVWLNDMAVDDPPPGMILSGYAVGIPIVFVLCSSACFLMLRVIDRRN